MTADKKVDPKSAAAAAAPKKGSKLLLLSSIAVVVLGGGGAGAYLFLKPKPAAAEGAAAEEHKSEVKHAAEYYKFDPAFVVNFGADGATRYLQVTVEAMSRDPLVVTAIKANEPAIRNDLVLLFSSQQYDLLITPQGKEQLRNTTLEVVRKVVMAEGHKGEAVEGVYFTSFVIQ